MEHQRGKSPYLQVKIRKRDLSGFSHPDLIGLYPLEDILILVFKTEKIDALLRDLLDFDPGIDFLEVGLSPTPGPLAGYRKVYSPRLKVVSPGPGLEPEPGEIILQSRLSFGSGFHPTTELSLLLLEEAFGLEKIERVFDLGTGSGILALAAAKLGASKILAADLDLRACKEARQNLKLNQLEERILVVQGSLDCAPLQTFDLVLANLTIGTILTLARELALPLRAGGLLILSGFVAAQVQEILSALGSPRVLAQKELEGWAGLLVSP